MQGASATPLPMGWLRLVGSLKITGLFCKRALYKRLYSAKVTYNFKEPTNRSHPITESPAEYSLFYTALLQKRPIILRSLLIVATPYAFM